MKNIPTPADNTFWETRPSIPLNSRAEWDQVKYNERPIYQDTDMISSQIDAYQYYSENNSVIHLHSHPFYEFIYCCNGNPHYLLDGMLYQLQKGDVLLIPPDVSHSPISLNCMKEPYVRNVIRIDKAFAIRLSKYVPTVLSDYASPIVLHVESKNQDFWEKQFLFCVREFYEKKPGWQATLVGQTLQLLGFLNRSLGKDWDCMPRPEKGTLLNKILMYIEGHLTDKITLKNTARLFSVSESTIVKLFRRSLNVSFSQYVTQRRLISAKAYLTEDKPLEQISEALGFSDYSTFYRAFRKEYGMGPLCFQKKQKAIYHYTEEFTNE